MDSPSARARVIHELAKSEDNCSPQLFPYASIVHAYVSAAALASPKSYLYYSIGFEIVLGFACAWQSVKLNFPESGRASGRASGRGWLRIRSSHAPPAPSQPGIGLAFGRADSVRTADAVKTGSNWTRHMVRKLEVQTQVPVLVGPAGLAPLAIGNTIGHTIGLAIGRADSDVQA